MIWMIHRLWLLALSIGWTAAANRLWIWWEWCEQKAAKAQQRSSSL